MKFESRGNSTERAAKAVMLIRVLVEWVFVSEGIQKFLFPQALGVGRFAKNWDSLGRKRWRRSSESLKLFAEDWYG